MIVNTCPRCGSTNWGYMEGIDNGYDTDGYWADWLCRCYDCKNDFERLENYKLTEATHDAFEED